MCAPSYPDYSFTTTALGAGLKLERRAERRSVPGKLWTAADERALRKTGGGKSGTTSDGGSSAKNGKSYEPIPGVSFSKGKGKSGGTSKGGYKLDFCRNCNFSVIYDELAAVQVVNGLVVNFDQIKGTKEIGICDTCKVSDILFIHAVSFRKVTQYHTVAVFFHGCWKNGCIISR